MDDGGILDCESEIARSYQEVSPALTAQRAVGHSRPRMVIADDDPIILDHVGGLLRNRFEIVAQARNGQELVEAVQKYSPTVVVADVTMPEVDGIVAARQITTTFPQVKVVMLSIHEDPSFVEAAFEAGASGYVLKLRASKELIPAVEEVLAGRHYRPPD